MHTEALVLCVGTDAEVGAEVARSAGGNVAVLIVPNVAAAIRVLNGEPAVSNVTSGIAFGPLRLDPASRIASYHGLPIELSARQFDLLSTLAKGGDRVWSYADLTQAVWQRRYVGDIDTVTSAVKRLRRRLAAVTSELVVTAVRGVGFRLTLRGSGNRGAGEASGGPRRDAEAEEETDPPGSGDDDNDGSVDAGRRESGNSLLPEPLDPGPSPVNLQVRPSEGAIRQ